jgi:hypothetical protein
MTNLINLDNLPAKRKIYIPTSYRVGKYKGVKTSDFGGGVSIFVKKRFLGFLWWIFVKDEFGNPVHFNKKYEANTFMRGVIKYDEDLLRVNLDMGKLKKNDDMDCVVKTHGDAYFNLTRTFYLKHGEYPEIECVKRAWHFMGGFYEYQALSVIELWHSIYKQTGKKIWLS